VYSVGWNNAVVNAYKGNGAPLNEELARDSSLGTIVKKRKFMHKIQQNALGGRAPPDPLAAMGPTSKGKFCMKFGY